MRLLVTLLVFVALLIPSALAMLFAVAFVIGPHGGRFPPSLETTAQAFGLICSLVVPLLAARRTWRRYPHKA